jgi:Inosine-uridine nucleoside N-ribohydrolase
VILDTDIGDDIDDALALALALQSPELDVLAVTTVLQHGERRADLTWRILELYGRTSIPVGVGAEQPLLAPGDKSLVRQTRRWRRITKCPRASAGTELSC